MLLKLVRYLSANTIISIISSHIYEAPAEFSEAFWGSTELYCGLHFLCSYHLVSSLGKKKNTVYVSAK